MRAFLLLAILSTVICVSVSASAATLYVDGSVSSSGDGASWETALKTIREGINKALEGDTVTVAEGVYIENIHFDGKNIILTSTDPLNPDVVAGTVIDGNQSGTVVTFSSTETEACTLSGFTVRNGNADCGGGICGGSWDFFTHATIMNNTIASNSADHGGGGGLAFCEGTIQNNRITGNSAGNGGGVAYCDGVMQNNTIAGNSATYDGGGLAGCNGTIQNNRITGNSATDYGGGLYCCDGTIQNNTIADNSGSGLAFCDGTIRNNTITGNSASSNGGGLYVCYAVIQNNVISGNSARDEGGGLADCNGTIRNNAITGNSARWGGGLVVCHGAVRNNTIAGNSATNYGGGLYGCDATIQNCIIWGNTAPSSPQFSGSSTLTYSCIDGWTGGGAGNIALDPQFVDPGGPDNDPDTYEDNDYHLGPESPCMDAGVNEEWMWEAVDLDGNPRILPGNSVWRVDMGAYEFISPTCTYTEYIRRSGDGIQLIWTSQEAAAYSVFSCLDLANGTWTEEDTVDSQGAATFWKDTSSLPYVKFYRVEMK